MRNDPIVEETRRLRDEFAKKHNYSIRAMVEELRQWEEQGDDRRGDGHLQGELYGLDVVGGEGDHGKCFVGLLTECMGCVLSGRRKKVI